MTGAPRYRAYVMDVSYFSGKLEAYLRGDGFTDATRGHVERVYHETLARLWNGRASMEQGGRAPAGALPEGWEELLRGIAQTHLPCLHANAVAWRDGRSRFDWTVQGTTYRSTPVVRDRVWCRERLQQHNEALAPDAKPGVRETLKRVGAWEPLWGDGVIPSGLHDGGEPPVCRPVVRRIPRLFGDGGTWNAR